MASVTPWKPPVGHIKYSNSLVWSVRTYPNIRNWSAVQMEGLNTIQDEQMVEKWDFWSNWPQKWPLWAPGDPLWVISSTLHSLVRLVGTFPNIKSWSAVQMKGLKTIKDDQMAEKWAFWSNWPQKWPLWAPGDPLWVISSTLHSLVRLVGTFPNIKSWSAVQMKGLKTIKDDQMAEKWDFWSNRAPKWPPWPPGRPSENSKIPSEG